MKNSQAHILLVDDDIALCELLAEYLSSVGFRTSSINDSEIAAAALKKASDYDLVVLDIMMPKMSGLEILKEVHSYNNIPILMLTGRGDEIDRIVGLEMGADDYLSKPCNPRELAARINAILRRHHKNSDIQEENTRNYGELSLSPKNLSASVKGQHIDFTGAEFRALQLLVDNSGRLLSKEYLTESVLGRPLTAHDRSIDVHISRIRQKLSPYGLGASIKSVRGAGYQMVEERI